MIVRSAIRCETCGKVHTVRIGMGQEEYHTYTFPCRECKEPIVLGLKVDYKKISHEVVCEKNATETDEELDAPIVNVDANFLIPEAEQGKDFVFPRLRQLHAMMVEAEAQGRLVPGSAIPKDMVDARPYRRKDYGAEWQSLRKAWSLHRNGQPKLVSKRLAEESKKLYPRDPLTSLPDWLWRFTLTICQPAFELRFRDAMALVGPLIGSGSARALAKHYSDHMANERRNRYFALMTDYFAGYSDFSQVHLLVATDTAIPADHHAASTDFDKTKMFYGNAFEALGSVVDFLAYLNNLLAGRPFDTFQQLSMEAYAKLDKIGRLGPFSSTPALAALCSEADNQLRNASHHGSIEYDLATNSVRYRAGKGGTGAEHQMSYSQYLRRCAVIFLSIMTILRIELIFCSKLGIRYPL